MKWASKTERSSPSRLLVQTMLRSRPTHEPVLSLIDGPIKMFPIISIGLPSRRVQVLPSVDTHSILSVSEIICSATTVWSSSRATFMLMPSELGEAPLKLARVQVLPSGDHHNAPWYWRVSPVPPQPPSAVREPFFTMTTPGRTKPAENETG